MRTQGDIVPVDNVLYDMHGLSGCSIGFAYMCQGIGIPNAQTWATAHNVANKLDAMGVDGLKAIEGLVGLVEKYHSAYEIDNKGRRLFVRAIAFQEFMQSIQRKADE